MAKFPPLAFCPILLYTLTFFLVLLHHTSVAATHSGRHLVSRSPQLPDFPGLPKLGDTGDTGDPASDSDGDLRRLFQGLRWPPRKPANKDYAGDGKPLCTFEKEMMVGANKQRIETIITMVKLPEAEVWQPFCECRDPVVSGMLRFAKTAGVGQVFISVGDPEKDTLCDYEFRSGSYEWIPEAFHVIDPTTPRFECTNKYPGHIQVGVFPSARSARVPESEVEAWLEENQYPPQN